MKSWHGIQKSTRVGMGGRLKNVLLAPDLDQVSRVHNRNAVGDFETTARSCEMKSIDKSKFLPQLGQQLENLRLNGDIERGGGFVGDQQLRTIHDGHGDHDALAHASGKLVRIITRARSGSGIATVVNASVATLPASRFDILTMSEHGLGDLVADTHHRIQRSHRLLEDHCDFEPRNSRMDSADSCSKSRRWSPSCNRITPLTSVWREASMSASEVTDFPDPDSRPYPCPIHHH